MKILCISDTTRSLAFSPMVKDIYKGVDLILSAGDMPLESYDYVSTLLHKDVCYVYGNHNLKDFRDAMNKDGLWTAMKKDDEYNKKFYGFMIDGKCYRDKSSGLLIAGLGGSMLYNNGDSQYSEKQMRYRIWKLIPYLMYNKKRYGRYLDILITHAPPLGIGDGTDLCHKGFKCFLDFIDKFEPKYLLHGHIHLDDLNLPRVRERGKTKIVNVYGSYLLDDDSLGGTKNGGR